MHYSSVSPAIKSKYERKFVSAEEAVSVIRSGDRVYIHPGCAVPQVLVDAMVGRYEELFDVEVCHLLGVGEAVYVRPEMKGHFRHNAFFIGKNVRKAVCEGRADFTPIFLSEIPSLIQSKNYRIDVALIQVSPPDEHGYCSFGVGVECTKTATDVAKVVVAQINSNMPRTLGDSFIHINKIDYCVEVDTPLRELPQMEGDETPEELENYRKIGENVASLIEDGSTLQLGIGRIPDATVKFLTDRKHLGIHSEMVSDGIIPLIESGVITNQRKTLLPGKTVTSFVLGSHELFNYIDNNPFMEFRPTQFTNDPFTVARNRKMVAVNSAIEIDLTGQVCADSMGYKFFSGFGGQTDFIRGASRSEGGKPIIALPSTAKDDTVSRITPHLREGAGVTTTRGDVHYVVTEYGIVNLHGKSVRERIELLISIAHPKFRPELEDFAREQYFTC
ncbi:MAG: acetyl-CoA hydrolase/transferase family protein [Bacteroidetes bacterium]|nr:acetyl-CoA hydrolase/transferase family protein [Bacteroidota bacterium]MCW5895519.1 acetyl-CoA hydrolase/transferase family protein [Bacteroidota bacterium]